MKKLSKTQRDAREALLTELKAKSAAVLDQIDFLNEAIEERFAALKTIEGDSDVLYSNGLEDRGLPKGSAIKFLLPFGRGQVNKVEIKIEGHHLHVYAWEQIAIHPASSNVFTIHTKPHRLP